MADAAHVNVHVINGKVTSFVNFTIPTIMQDVWWNDVEILSKNGGLHGSSESAASMFYDFRAMFIFMHKFWPIPMETYSRRIMLWWSDGYILAQRNLQSY